MAEKQTPKSKPRDRKAARTGKDLEWPQEEIDFSIIEYDRRKNPRPPEPPPKPPRKRQ